jgi:hypothetical protein
MDIVSFISGYALGFSTILALIVLAGTKIE